MKYHLMIDWNGNRVLDARLTASIAHDIIQRVCAGQFSGPVLQEMHIRLPKLRTILDYSKGNGWSGTFSDTTGRVFIDLERVED